MVRQATAVSLASAGPHDVQAGDRAQRPQMLDRLVGRAVLAEADRVVRPDVGHRQLHQRGQPDRPPHVVAEDQEGAAVRPGAAVQRDAVQDRAHRVLADAEVQGPAVGVAREHLGLVNLGDERRLARHRGVVAAGQVGRAAPQLGQHRRQRVQHLAGRLPGRDALRVGRELRQRVGPAVRQRGARTSGRAAPAGRAFRFDHAANCSSHSSVGLLAAVGDLAGVRDQASSSAGKRHVRVEAEDLLGGGDLVRAERRAVRRAGVLLVRGRPADDRAQRDERRLRRRLPAPSAARRTAPARPRGTRRLSASSAAARASRRPRTWRATSSDLAMLVSSSIEMLLSS